jgi:hypothetical protein
MWNKPTQKQLERIPRLYGTEGTTLENKEIHMHFFLGSCDWYIAEWDGEDIFYGYATLNGDHQMAEWGYTSFAELKNLKVKGWLEIDRDMHWTVKKASEIPNIYPHGVACLAEA